MTQPLFWDWAYKPGSVRLAAQQSSIFTWRHRQVQVKDSATMKYREQQLGKNPENQGVASDRVYSGSMLP